nr:hypothetical protein L204_03127 [Cryptococcus depauperatus CBS 7855]
MPDDLSFLDQLEDWLEAQVPQNLHDLPYKVLDTMEKMTNELFDTLNVHGPPSISLPFPPFGGKEAPPPPPPPPPPSNAAMKCYSQVASRSERFVKTHYVAIGAAVSVGIGLAGFMVYKGVGIFGKDWKVKRHFGQRGVVQDGMLKEAIGE